MAGTQWYKAAVETAREHEGPDSALTRRFREAYTKARCARHSTRARSGLTRACRAAGGPSRGSGCGSTPARREPVYRGAWALLPVPLSSRQRRLAASERAGMSARRGLAPVGTTDHDAARQARTRTSSLGRPLRRRRTPWAHCCATTATCRGRPAWAPPATMAAVPVMEECITEWAAVPPTCWMAWAAAAACARGGLALRLAAGTRELRRARRSSPPCMRSCRRRPWTGGMSCLGRCSHPCAAGARRPPPHPTPPHHCHGSGTRPRRRPFGYAFLHHRWRAALTAAAQCGSPLSCGLLPPRPRAPGGSHQRAAASHVGARHGTAASVVTRPLTVPGAPRASVVGWMVGLVVLVGRERLCARGLVVVVVGWWWWWWW